MAEQTRVTALPPLVPRRGGRARRTIGLVGLASLGWRVRGTMPNERKFVVIVAPHTSNWDFVIGFFTYLALQLDASWFGKHTIFRGPVGPILRYFGGIPVDRGRSANLVDAFIAEFTRRDRMVLALAPEGTRKRVAEWKSGFYRIAQAAQAPIVPVAFDYRTREVRIMAPPPLTGDSLRDLTTIRAHFEAAMAKHPDQFHDEGTGRDAAPKR